MAVPWLRLRATFISNGKVGEAGLHGAAVYLSLLCIHSLHGEGGILPRERVTARRLRVEAAALLADLTVAEVDSALQACTMVGLVSIDDAHLRILGWDRDSMPTCSRCGRPNPQPRFGTCPPCRERDFDRGKKPDPTGDPTGDPNKKTADPTGDPRARQDHPRPDQSGSGTKYQDHPSRAREGSAPADRRADGLGELRSGVDGLDGLGLGRSPGAAGGDGGGALPARLIRLGFAGGSESQFGQVLAFAAKLRELHPDPADIDLLLRQAEQGRNPCGLLQTWVKRGDTEKVIQRAKRDGGGGRRKAK